MSILTTAAVRLTYAGGLYDRTAPLATGEVRPEGIDLNYGSRSAPCAATICGRMASRTTAATWRR